MAEPLKVRGKCPKCGRTVNRTAPKGRLTWKGDCPATGCLGVITARRVKDAQATATADEHGTPPPAPGKAAPRKVVKVSGYERTVSDEPAAGVPAAAGAAGGPDPAGRGGDGSPTRSGAPEHGGGGPAKPKPVARAEPKKRHPYGDLFGW